MLQVRLAFLNSEFLGHGTVYNEKARQLSSAQKATSWDRDQGRCVRCGGPGAEVDHINDSSNEPSNLQLLCLDCHHAKTRQSMVLVTDAADRDALHAFYAGLGRRIDAPEPVMACDNEQAWGKSWRRWPDIAPSALAYASGATTLSFADFLRMMAAASAA